MSNEGGIGQAFTSHKQQGVDALIIATDIFYHGQMQRLLLSGSQAVPTVGPLRDFAAGVNSGRYWGDYAQGWTVGGRRNRRR
jgi:hypothetical protein